MTFQSPTEHFYMVFGPQGAPRRFWWRGQPFRVDAIERIWRSAQGKPRRQRFYRVRCGDQAFLLRHDCIDDRWSVVRSPWRARFGLALADLARRMTR